MGELTWITVAEAAERLGVSAKTVRRMRGGRLRWRNVGERKTEMCEQDVADLLRARGETIEAESA